MTIIKPAKRNVALEMLQNQRVSSFLVDPKRAQNRCSTMRGDRLPAHQKSQAQVHISATPFTASKTKHARNRKQCLSPQAGVSPSNSFNQILRNTLAFSPSESTEVGTMQPSVQRSGMTMQRSGMTNSTEPPNRRRIGQRAQALLPIIMQNHQENLEKSMKKKLSPAKLELFQKQQRNNAPKPLNLTFSSASHIRQISSVPDTPNQKSSRNEQHFQTQVNMQNLIHNINSAGNSNQNTVNVQNFMNSSYDSAIASQPDTTNSLDTARTIGRAAGSPNEQKLWNIVTQIIKFKGKDPNSTRVQRINKMIGGKMMEQEFRNEHTINVANKISGFAEYQPRVLQWLFQEDMETQLEESESQRACIADFEARKLNTKYFAMLEKGSKNSKKKKQAEPIE